LWRINDNSNALEIIQDLNAKKGEKEIENSRATDVKM
jgi:hypothetical protein